MDKSRHSGEIVITKDKAVFWMDGRGCWRNRHGVFQHKKIIDYFNASIQKDENGYYLTQHRDNIIEKVYFHYEETALFVVDLVFDDPVVIKLNTGLETALRPKALFVCKDDLYYRMEDQLVKFNQRALLKISEKMIYDRGRYVIKIGHEPVVIEERTDVSNF